MKNAQSHCTEVIPGWKYPAGLRLREGFRPSQTWEFRSALHSLSSRVARLGTGRSQRKEQQVESLGSRAILAMPFLILSPCSMRVWSVYASS